MAGNSCSINRKAMILVRYKCNDYMGSCYVHICIKNNYRKYKKITWVCESSLNTNGHSRRLSCVKGNTIRMDFERFDALLIFCLKNIFPLLS